MSAPNSPNQYIPLGVRASSVPPQPQLPERSPVNTPQPANNSPEEPDIDNIDDGNDSNSNYANEEVMLEEAAEILGFRVAVRRYSQKDLLDATDSLLTFVYIYAFLIDKSLVNIAVRYVASITAMNSRTGFTISVALGIMVLTNVLNIVRHVSMGMSKHGFDSTGVIVDFIGCSSPHLLMVLVVDLFAMFVEFVRIFAYSPLHFSKAHTARFLALILAAERMEDIVDVFAEESSEGNGSEAASPDQTPEAAENDGDQVVLSIDAENQQQQQQQSDAVARQPSLVFTVFSISRESIAASVRLDSELTRRYREAAQQDDPPDDSPPAVAGATAATTQPTNIAS